MTSGSSQAAIYDSLSNSKFMDFLFEFAKLIKTTPKHQLPQQDNENCPYNSFLYKSRNCYLCYSSSYLDSCYYIDNSGYNKDCADCDYSNHCELCYECVDCDSCYNCNFSQDCRNCTDCSFCYGCQDCSNCFGCAGLYKKDFYIFNEPYSKESYLKKIEEVKTLPVKTVLSRMNMLRGSYAHPPMHSWNNEQSFGEYIKNCKNCFMCFNGEKAEDCAYIYDEVYNLKDCVDCSHVTNSQLCYNSMSMDNCYNVDFSWWMVNCRDCMFGFCNNGCSNCFGCINLQRKEFFILNAAYTKESYFKKIAEIKDDLAKKKLFGGYLIIDAVELSKTL